jgi:hypothetical protein
MGYSQSPRRSRLPVLIQPKKIPSFHPPPFHYFLYYCHLFRRLRTSARNLHFEYHIHIEMAQRAQQIASHLNYPAGLLAGQVAIVSHYMSRPTMVSPLPPWILDVQNSSIPTLSLTLLRLHRSQAPDKASARKPPDSLQMKVPKSLSPM